MNRFIFVNPQWQGGADTSTYYGAKELADYYLHDVEYTELPVSLDPVSSEPVTPEIDSPDADSLKTDPFISAADKKTDTHATAQNKDCMMIDQDIILKQTQDALDHLRFAKRGKSLTIGGSCDADLASILYLNDHFSGDIAVLWLDAHGDINSPSESGSKLFYGMPVRTLLGESDGIFDHIITTPMMTDQFINAGGRALDQTETDYFSKNGIPVIPVPDFSEKEKNTLSDTKAMLFDRFADTICEAVCKTGKRRLYIHLDLDFLEPCDEVSTTCPEPEGLPKEYLMPLLERLDREFHLTGLGIFQYKPCGIKSDLLDKVIDFGLNF